MNSNDMKEVDFSSSDIFISPKFAIRRMIGVGHKYGRLNAIKSSSFQQVRECYIAGVFLLGLSHITKINYWLQPNSDPNNAPDVFAISIRNPKDKSEIGVVREVWKIEIFEYEDHSRDDLTTHILKKVKDKRYGKDTVLVCFVHKSNILINPEQLFNDLEKYRLEISEIWLLFQCDLFPNSDYVISKIFGDKACLVINFNHKQYPVQKDILSTRRAKSKTLKFEPKGEVILRFPKLRGKVNDDKSTHN